MSDFGQTKLPATDGGNVTAGRMRVSVCMVAYNHEAYIAQAVESVLAQSTNFEFELVIGEDCSPDRTREILQQLATSHPRRMRLRLAERNEGASRNFVQTLALCRGEFIVILEGDDYFSSPEKLQKQVDALDAHPEWAMCFHPTRCLYEGGAATGPEFTPEKWDRPEATILDLFERNFMATSSVMYRHGLFGELPEWFTEVVIGDWVLHILNAVHGNIGYLPEPMSVYRIHGGGIFSSQSLTFKLVTIFKMLSKLDHHLAGRFMMEIDENRLHTVRWLVGQWENEQRIAKEAIAKLGYLESWLDARGGIQAAADANVEGNFANRLSMADYLSALESKVVHAETEADTYRAKAERTEAAYQQLRSESAEFRKFHEIWSKSILYRIYRETVRPFRRFRQYPRSAKAAQTHSPPECDHTSRRKAA